MSGAAREETFSLPASSDGFEEAVAVVQAKLRAAVDRAGLRQDPYGQLIAALSSVVGVFPQFLQQLGDRVARRRPRSCAQHAGRPTRGCGAGGDDGRRVAGGYLWGRADAAASFHATEADLGAAFRNGPAVAAKWRDLMRWNNPANALQVCDRGQAFTDRQSGRWARIVPLWIEPPKIRQPE